MSAQVGAARRPEPADRLCFTIVVEKGAPAPLAPTARAALDDAIHRQPASMFDTERLNVPPAGRWVVDARESGSWQTRFDHLSAAGRIDWTAYVFRSDESWRTKPRRGWYYGGGGRADFPVRKTISICSPE